MLNKETSLSGDFYNSEDELIAENKEGTLHFNRFYFHKSSVVFEGFAPSTDRNESIIFKDDKGISLNLKFSSSNISETKYHLDKLVIPNSSEGNYPQYHSGIKSNFMPREITSSLGYEIKEKRIPRDLSEEKNDKFLILKANEELSDTYLLRYFLLLSTLSCDKFFVREIHKKEKITFINRTPRRKQLLIYGSGDEYFPLSLVELENVFQNSDIELLENFLLLYTSFTTTEGEREQLINGLSLLDYLFDICKKDSEFGKVSGSQSLKLIKVLDILLDDDKQREYVEKLFKTFPGFKAEKVQGFEFWELRNRFIHRGNLIETSEEFIQLHHNIFVVNEILRLILLNFNKINYQELSHKGFYEVRNMKESIKLRSQILKSQEA